ncbi:MAG: pyruvate dehydrogenase [Deltaproteobacteria bacterium]|nr:pyruvate dehydrogenase [Deltaproteobacteria bacterium]
MRDEKEVALIERIARRVLAYATKMIWDANHRDDVMEGDPKVGGHPAACSSCVHIMSALHLGVRQPQDMIAVKPHGSPIDHSLNHLMQLFHTPKGREWLSTADAEAVMGRLRKFSEAGEPVFQSYHAESDPDGNVYFPSGSVGIPPVVSMYTSLAYRYAADHDLSVPKDAYFWSLIGDSEFREGSLMEAMPDAAERELGNVIWIVDYNRQNLDGTRIPNMRGLRGTDAGRMERVAAANGWDVIQVAHGRKRLRAFEAEGGARFKDILENAFSDFEFQTMLLKQDGSVVRDRMLSLDKRLDPFLKSYDDKALYALYADLGGHDISVLLSALRRAKLDPISPTLVIAHTVKGWGLPSLYAAPGNHSALPTEEEVDALLAAEGLSKDAPFALFDEGTDEAAFLARRRDEMRAGQVAIWDLREKNVATFKAAGEAVGGLPETLGLNLKYLPLVHTQYVWGQLAAKVIRMGTTYEQSRSGQAVEKPLVGDEVRWGPAADLVLTMAPDVGTSTNINPAMDDRIYGPQQDNYETSLGVGDRRRPKLAPHEEPWSRHIRFEIAEANCVSAAGAFGKIRESLGIPFLPVMTIYDFFIKRAFDQLYYNLYWGSSFICVGTPSGITLAPEGAQHSWKNHIAMPNCITWEPFYALEVDWILAESIRLHYLGENSGRSGVIIRAVTRAFQQKQMLEHLRIAKRFEGVSDDDVLEATRRDALQGGYYLIDWRDHPGYEPGENVVHIFAMGAMGQEAVDASKKLVEEGIFANVIIATSSDLLSGNLAHKDGYRHLREGLGVTGDLYLSHAGAAKNGAVAGNGAGNGRAMNGGAQNVYARHDIVLAAGRRVPLIAIVDGEPGIMDNLGSVVGVPCETLAVRKASKSGRPVDVYRYHGMDPDSIVAAAGRLLSTTALENVRLSSSFATTYAGRSLAEESVDAAELWPPRQ